MTRRVPPGVPSLSHSPSPAPGMVARKNTRFPATQKPYGFEGTSEAPVPGAMSLTRDWVAPGTARARPRSADSAGCEPERKCIESSPKRSLGSTEIPTSRLRRSRLLQRGSWRFRFERASGSLLPLRGGRPYMESGEVCRLRRRPPRPRGASTARPRHRLGNARPRRDFQIWSRESVEIESRLRKSSTTGTTSASSHCQIW